MLEKRPHGNQHPLWLAVAGLIGWTCLWTGIGAQELDSEDCFDCHDQVSVEESIHAGLECLDCHQAVLELGIDHADGYQTDCEDVCESCGSCHSEANAEFMTSVHGESLFLKKDGGEAAYCYSCHGNHDILPSDDPKSLTYPLNLAQTCGKCHAKQELVRKYKIPNLHPVELFSKSYHAKRLYEGGDLMAATCNDCHGVHNIKVNTDPTSTISHSNISSTCGGCHKQIYEAYTRSIHWQALARGQRESPTCIDCHGEHEIMLPSDPKSPVSKRRAAEQTCARCHTDERLVSKYGLIPGKVSSYQDSYHGLAVMKGARNAATCYDCHNAHEIRSADDPHSSVFTGNLRSTCARCHPRATDNFAKSYTHQSVILAEKPVEYYVRVAYLLIIVVVIGGMLLHNALIFWQHLRRKFRREQQLDYIQRYSRTEVWQHLVLIVSFFTLVITGFALKYSETFWGQALSFLGLNEYIRGLLHRIAAVVMIILSVWHLVEGFSTRRGRQFFRAMIPGRSDLTGFIQQMKYYLNRSEHAARFDRFDYTEKAEYWALLWGTIIMVVSGFILWFPVTFSRNAPVWLIKVAETFHLYEAWLATLAILVWHFFFVILHPGEYPMSMTWLHGRMSIEEYRHKHPQDYQRIMDEVEAYRTGNRKLSELSFQAREFVTRHKLERGSQSGSGKIRD